MPNPDHLEILNKGVASWNQWRANNPDIQPNISNIDLSKSNLTLRGVDFSGTDLSGTILDGVDLSDAELYEANLTDAKLNNTSLSRSNLHNAKLFRAKLFEANLHAAFLEEAYLVEANLSNANLVEARLQQAMLNSANLSNATLTGADLSDAILIDTNLRKANLIGANLNNASLIEADLSDALLNKAHLEGANLSGANLTDTKLHDAIFDEANLNRANLTGAELIRANLEHTSLIETNLTNADLSDVRIYGISAWGVKLIGATQSNLIITPFVEPVITVDNLEIAQFIYLLLNNAKLRDVISTIGNKVVLILGRFTPPERKEILDVLKENLRKHNLIPIVFDFEKAKERDFTETIKVLAGMSLFVIADITNPKSTPLELQGTIPDYMIPFVPIIQKGEDPFSMFADLQHKYPWVMEVRRYEDKNHLINYLEDSIIKPALEKHIELVELKNQSLIIRNIEDFSKPV